jgi:hypothetical protein
MELRIRHSGTVELPAFGRRGAGVLVAAEAQERIPFSIKRAYWITGLSRATPARGGHAHKKTDQYIFCVSGSCMLLLDDGAMQQRVRLSKPNVGIRLGPGLWHEMYDFSDGCVLLVLASAPYRESDYIRDRDAFSTFTQKRR